MEKQNLPFEDIQDALGVRIITDSVINCYALLGTVHAIFKPVIGSFTDYIAVPKMNLYQSLHTSVMAPSGEGGSAKELGERPRRVGRVQSRPE